MLINAHFSIVNFPVYPDCALENTGEVWNQTDQLPGTAVTEANDVEKGNGKK